MDLTKLSWAPATQFHACCPRLPLQVQIRVWPTFPPTVGSMCHRCIGGGPGQYSGAAGKARLYDKKAGGERSSHLGIRTRATRSTMLLIVHQRRICSNTTTSGSGPQHRTLPTRNTLLQHIYENTLQLLYAITYQHKSASTSLVVLEWKRLLRPGSECVHTMTCSLFAQIWSLCNWCYFALAHGTGYVHCASLRTLAAKSKSRKCNMWSW